MSNEKEFLNFKYAGTYITGAKILVTNESLIIEGRIELFKKSEDLQKLCEKVYSVPDSGDIVIVDCSINSNPPEIATEWFQSIQTEGDQK
jgi:hypothetical protein